MPEAATKKDIQDLQKKLDSLNKWVEEIRKSIEANDQLLADAVHASSKGRFAQDELFQKWGTELTKAVNDLAARVSKLES